MCVCVCVCVCVFFLACQSDDAKLHQTAKEEMDRLSAHLSKAQLDLQTAQTSLQQYVEVNEQAGITLSNIVLFLLTTFWFSW